jgi:hypothetical protein
MPKLYIFVTCEKAITDSEGLSSLIALFNELTVFIPEGATPPPPNAVVAKDWAIFSSWEMEPEDEGKEFREFFQVLYPNDTPFAQEISFPFRAVAGKKYNQVIALSKGFPIGQQGRYAVQMRLEQDGVKIFGPVVIRMDVKYTPVPASSAASAF